MARLGIPSFVVTLAAFLGLQGVVLQLLGEGGDIRGPGQRLLALNNNTLPVWLGWALCVAVVAWATRWSCCAGSSAGGPAACRA